MSDVPQTYLPDELVHAVLIRVKDSDESYKPIKRGLASCSLTCRHWASLIRPLLFEELTVKSAEDIAQLLDFLDSPNILHPSTGIQDCVADLHVIDDRTSSSIPWDHQMLRLHRLLPLLLSFAHRISNGGADDELDLGHPPLVVIPRTLPGSATPPRYLKLSHLRLPSPKALVSYIKHLAIRSLVLRAVTFAKEDIPDIQRRRSRLGVRPFLHVTAFRCFEDIAGFQRWFRIINALLACQGCLWVDDAVLTMIEKYMVILLLHSPHAMDEGTDLMITGHPSEYMRNNGEHPWLRLVETGSDHLF